MKKELQSNFETRQYMIFEDFELYYYNDKNIAKVESHSHDYYEFYFFLEGDISLQIENNIFPIESGDMVIIPPHIYHSPVIHSTDIPYRRFVFWISKDFYSHLSQLSGCYTYITDYIEKYNQYIFHLEQIPFNTFQSKIIRMLEEMHSERFGKQVQLEILVKDFIFNINRYLYDSSEHKAYKNSLYSNLIDFIEEHIDEDLSLDRLADKYFVSKYHIAHIFKEYLGISIHRYITKKRLALCKDAICTNQNITSVYQTYGFKDYSSFYRAFKKEFGVSPQKYKSSQCDILKDTNK